MCCFHLTPKVSGEKSAVNCLLFPVGSCFLSLFLPSRLILCPQFEHFDCDLCGCVLLQAYCVVFVHLLKSVCRFMCFALVGEFAAIILISSNFFFLVH